MTKEEFKEKQQEKTLVNGLAYANRYINRQYLTNIDIHSVEKHQDDFREIRLFHMSKLVFDMNENTNDKLISVYGALNSIQSTVLIILRSFRETVEIYIGSKCKEASTAGSILKESLKGNFGGSELTNLDGQEIRKVMSESVTGLDEKQSVSSVTLVPSLRDEEKEKYVQGLEKLIDSMAGREYTAFFIAEPVKAAAIEAKKRGLEHLYATISPFSETSLSYGKNTSSAVTEGTFTSFSSSINESITNSTSQSEFYSHAEGTNSSFGFSGSGEGGGASFGFGSSSTDSYGSSQAWSNAVTKGTAKTDSEGSNFSRTETTGENRTLTVTHQNKSVIELMEHIDRQLMRIRECESFGLWSCAAYFVSRDIQTTVIGASTLRALLAGDGTQIDRSFINTWDSTNMQTRNVLNSISHGSHPVIDLPRENQYAEQRVKPTVLVSGKELPLFLSLPHHSVPGLAVDYMASFGRAVFNPDENRNSEKIKLGNILHKGVVQEVPVNLDLEEFRSHCFITGSTGSGKSNTTYHLISSFIEKKKSFLVIEPAKGEYKYAFGNVPDINIFWTNPSTYRLLHLNPFSFPEEIHILEHLDRLIEIFNACWPLYSAMPAILKSAVERVYNRCGWDLINSKYLRDGIRQFPTFEDLMHELPEVIGESGYSSETKGDYIGALCTRVGSLTNGIMGSIFCSGAEIQEEILFDQSTIVDLSRVGSSETKSLIMGILVMKLNEHRIAKSCGMNLPLKHITILEEAHNLLRRTNTDQSAESANVAGKSVEMISNSIAEMRTYGEGFIIVDQSPTAVDISAIKNTNTKIVMRLPERADFETVGNAFALNEEQIREISRLRRGTAIVSQSGWLEPVMVSIERATDIYETPAQKVRQDALDDGVIELLLETVERQFESRFFNERVVKKIVEKSRLSQNRKEMIMSEYRMLVRKESGDAHVNIADISRFVIETIGCKELANIYPLYIRRNEEISTNKAVFARWQKNIVNQLKHYTVIHDEGIKIDVSRKLLIYMARIVKKPMYVNALTILNGK